jgi:thioredoxin 1
MLTVYRFTADWCGPCKIMAPTVEQLMKEYNVKDSEVEIVNLDADLEDNRALAAKYNVRSIPTLIFEKDGAEVDRTVGVKTYDELNERIKSHK